MKKYINKFFDIDKKTYNIEGENYPVFYSKIKKDRIDKVVISPKIKEQLYKLPEGMYLKIDGKVNGLLLNEVEILRRYNKYDDSIVVLERFCGPEGGGECKHTLKANDIFKALGITKEMTSIDYYKKNFKKYRNDKQIILPEVNIDIINELFKCYIYYDKKNTFLSKAKENKEIDRDDIFLTNTFNFFDTKVNSFLYNLCICYVAMHEYDYPEENKKKQNDKDEIHRICKIKLPWMNTETLDIYLEHLWYKKGAWIWYKWRVGNKQIHPLDVFARQKLNVPNDMVNRWLDDELVEYVENRVIQENRVEELNEFVKGFYKK